MRTQAQESWKSHQKGHKRACSLQAGSSQRASRSLRQEGWDLGQPLLKKLLTNFAKLVIQHSVQLGNCNINKKYWKQPCAGSFAAPYNKLLKIFLHQESPCSTLTVGIL